MVEAVSLKLRYDVFEVVILEGAFPSGLNREFLSLKLFFTEAPMILERSVVFHLILLNTPLSFIRLPKLKFGV